MVFGGWLTPHIIHVEPYNRIYSRVLGPPLWAVLPPMLFWTFSRVANKRSETSHGGLLLRPSVAQTSWMPESKHSTQLFLRSSYFSFDWNIHANPEWKCIGAKFANWIKSTAGRVDPRNAFWMLLLRKLQQPSQVQVDQSYFCNGRCMQHQSECLPRYVTCMSYSVLVIHPYFVLHFHSVQRRFRDA